MRDPFVAALDALFRAPGSAAAVYTGADGMLKPIRVILGQPTRDVPYGDTRAVTDTNVVQVQRSAAPGPARGDTLAIGAVLADGVVTGGESFAIIGSPMLDVEGLTWTCELQPI